MTRQNEKFSRSLAEKKISREEKKDLVLAVIMLRQETLEKSEKISNRSLAKLAESKLYVRIAAATLNFEKEKLQWVPIRYI